MQPKGFCTIDMQTKHVYNAQIILNSQKYNLAIHVLYDIISSNQLARRSCTFFWRKIPPCQVINSFSSTTMYIYNHKEISKSIKFLGVLTQAKHKL